MPYNVKHGGALYGTTLNIGMSEELYEKLKAVAIKKYFYLCSRSYDML